MEALHIGSRREVCWDEFLMESAEGVRVQMHRPEYRETIMNMDKGWEGQNCGYFTVIREGEMHRVYYRAANMEKVDWNGADGYAHKNYYCVMETRDGKNFTRVPVNEIPFMGIKDNNIIIPNTGSNGRAVCNAVGLFSFAAALAVFTYHKKRKTINHAPDKGAFSI